MSIRYGRTPRQVIRCQVASGGPPACRLGLFDDLATAPATAEENKSFSRVHMYPSVLLTVDLPQELSDSPALALLVARLKAQGML